ncbi:hypothetical protein LAZ67_22001320 [Cordylochernes scorpioides]|uniref:Uncharacterized protein n=1 Tax=Cordylochernes scorpioides TaxID=51811 RepID=A0ABY6LNV1_9ARAC|nr:hypothetical protein LAZ67_22001320 [Cordylochernes scorpioides]
MLSTILTCSTPVLRLSLLCAATQYRPVAEWQTAVGGSLPGTPVQGGVDSNGEPIYVGRAHHNGDNIPGKVVPSHGCCYVSWSGDEHSHHDYQVLCNPSYSQLEWQWADGSNIPPGAIQGGATADGEPLYIGRHEHDGSMTIGKVHPSHGCVYLPFGGSEHSYSNYEILVCRSICF